jgi:hypothetical protein
MGKDAEVIADFDEDHGGRDRLDAGDGLQQLPYSRSGAMASINHASRLVSPASMSRWCAGTCSSTRWSARPPRDRSGTSRLGQITPWAGSAGRQQARHIQTGDTAIEGFHSGPPRSRLRSWKTAGMPFPTACVKTTGEAHFTVRSQRNHLGCDGAGQDRVKRRGRTTKRTTISCPLSCNLKEAGIHTGFHAQGRAGSRS